jgi:hypothetical protein
MKPSPSPSTLLAVGALALSPFATVFASDAETAIELAEPVKLPGLNIEALEGPEFADVDGDGKRDLLSGTYSGSLLFRKNIGSEGEPEFSAAVPLQAGGEDIKIKHW